MRVARGPVLSALILLLAWKSLVVEGFSDGAPVNSCDDLSVVQQAHLNAPPQITAVPYRVDLSDFDDGNGAFQYIPGESYDVRVVVNDTTDLFRGILLQARVVADDSITGSFEQPPDDSLIQLSACLPNNDVAVTHDNRFAKTEVSATWIAPPAGTGAVEFGFAAVREQAVYWNNQRSGVISESATVDPATTDGNPMTPATDDSTTDPIAPVTEDSTTDPMTPVTDDSTTDPMTPATDDSMTDPTMAETTDSTTMGMGGDPHFSITLPSNKKLCYSIQGESGFRFNLVSNKAVQMNALFVQDEEREEVTWIGGLGIVFKNSPYRGSKHTGIKFDAAKKLVQIGGDTLHAERIDKITFENGKLSISEAKRKFNCTCFPIQVDLRDVGLNFSVHFVKNNHLDMKWDSADYMSSDSNGIIGQFFRKGVDIDETRRMLILPDMEPVPVMRRPIWSFMERDQKNKEASKFCWVAMNGGYQGKGLIKGSYLDYVVDDLLSTKLRRKF